MVGFSHLGVFRLKKIFIFPAAVLSVVLSAHAQAAAPAAPATTPTKVVVIQVQNAILSTKDGQKAAGELQTKFAPKKAEIDKKQADIAAMQDQLKKLQATGSEDVKTKLMRDIDSANTRLQRDTQDAQTDLDEEQQKVMQELGGKMMAVVEKYAQANGVAMVVDVSNPQTPVLWASQAIDITAEIIKLYDQANPGTGAPAAGAPAAPATRPTGLTPSTPPAVKKK
jgi:outer membrane protein